MSVEKFSNEPALNLRDVEVRSALRRSLEALDRRLPLPAPSDVAGVPNGRGGAITSRDPADPQRVVAVADVASSTLVDQAVCKASSAAATWGQREPQHRADRLRRAAELVLSERCDLIALLVRESGKPWDEADGEVAEAVDMLRYYAAAAIPSQLLPSSTRERNEVRLLPRGPVAVISPWNFPLAIPMGMTAGALAGGNSVVLKPAEQTPACGTAVVRILRAAGIPEEAVSVVQGAGATGALLARHPDVVGVAFTGSVAVGRKLTRVVGAVPADRRAFKRLVAELGGKNCAIVAADADLVSAADAIMRSAFSYAGQKCSAVSRVICEQPAADDLRELLTNAVHQLRVGPAEDFDTSVPPVISRTTQRRLARRARQASEEGCTLAIAPTPSGRGYYAPPTIVADLPRASTLLRDELFGPILTFESAPDLAAACQRVDELPMGLTGGVFAGSRDTLEFLIRHSPVGNLYVNRPTVGALIGRQPFGGSRLSGTGHKAGGPNYVAAFCDEQVICEAFAP